MTILDILAAPWAIQPNRLLEIQAIYAAHVRGEKVDIAAVEARLGKPLNNERRAYEVKDGVAILSMEGVLAKRMNLFGAISGGTSTQLLQQDLQAALSDSSVHSIVLAIDSPGGTVDGTQLFSDAVFSAREQKPIVAWATGTMASAAYWSGSAARSVYIADATTAVGSIGVVTSHVDVSAAETARGIKTTEITAGRYKRIASQYGPLSDEGRQSIQDQLDYLYSLFVGAVAKHRGVNEEKVVADMADGRMFTGQQAVDAGLVDGIMTLDALVAQLNEQRPGAFNPVPKRSNGASVRPYQQPLQGTNHMTAEELETNHPQLAASLRAEGAVAERARIQAVEGQMIPGHEALIEKMKYDGKSNAGDAAMAVLAAEKTARAAFAAAADADAPAPVRQAPAPAVQVAESEPQSRADLDKKAKDYMAANPGVSYVVAYKAVGGH